MIDGDLRIFRPLDFRFLIRQFERMKDATDMFSRVFDAPFFEDEIGDDARRPAIGRIAGGFRSLQNHGFEFVALMRREFGQAARTGFSCEAVQPVAFDFRPPSFDRGGRTFGNLDDFVVVETAQDQLSGLMPNGRLP